MPDPEKPIYQACFDQSPLATLLVDDERHLVAVNEAGLRLLGQGSSELAKQRVQETLQEPAFDGLWPSVLAGERHVAQLSGRTVSLSARANVQPGLHVLVMLDVEEQRAALRITRADRDQLFAAEQRGRERVTRLQTVTAALSRARTLIEVAHVIAYEGCIAFEALRGVVALMINGGSSMEVVSVRAGSADEHATPGMQFSLEIASPMSDAVRTLEPQIYESAEQLEARFPAVFQDWWSNCGAMVAMPLSLHMTAIGALALSYEGARKFTSEDRRDLESFARLSAWALERARLFDVAQLERRHAEEANRVKDEFLAVVSHELRTPLHAMLGWATLARSGRLDGEQLERALKTIERNAHAQAKLVDDLLDVTRITSGKLRLNVEPVSPSAVVEAALDVIRPAADAKGVRLELDKSETHSGMLTGDPDRLQQVIWNLLSNAVKFSDRGGLVRVVLSERDRALCIRIEDSGRGIEPSFLPHVYERFRQAETSQRGRLGLGLGLSIVKQLVELHGGTIEASSEGLGHGAVFTVVLPLAGERPTVIGTPGSLPPREVRTGLTYPTQLRGLSALVIDDEQESRDLLSSLFASCEMQVHFASSAAEGYAAMLERRFDVLISDLSLPDEDGYSLIGRVRQLPKDQGGTTPAVALTAHAKWEDRTRALLAGFDTHVSKPVAPAELLVVVANVSGRLLAGR